MIYTDGIPTIAHRPPSGLLERTRATIAALPETAEPEYPALSPPSEPLVLHERSTGGHEVTLLYRPGTRRVSIRVREPNGAVWSATVAPENALDAFEHPYCYLRREQQ